MSRPLPPDADARRRIDTDLDHNLLVAAGAGSGKTSKLVDRYLAVLAAGYEPRQMVVVTFTRKAAAEMKQRLRQRLSGPAADAAQRRWARALDEAPIETIDAFCLRLLRSEAMNAGLDPGFEVLPPDDHAALRQTACQEVLRAALHADDSAAEALLAEHDSYQTVVALLTGALSLRRLWRDPYQSEPSETVPAAMWRYLRGAAEAPPDAATVVTALAAARESAAKVWLDDFRAQQAGPLAAALDTLTPPAGEADTFLPFYRAARAVAEAPDNVALRAAFEALLAVGSPGNRGSAKVWGPDLTPVRQQVAALVKQLGGSDAAVLWADDALEASCASSTVALLPLLRAAEEAEERAKRARSALPFEDLILKAAELLCAPAHGEVLERLRRRWPVVLVDEYQDTDALQDRFFRHLCGDRPGAFFAVGDDKQSIYAFRGAEIEVFNRARATAGGDLVPLTATFRLAPRLAEQLNRLFRHDEVMGPAEHDSLSAARFAPLSAVADAARVLLPGEPVRRLEVTGANRAEAVAAEAAAIAAQIHHEVMVVRPRLTDWTHHGAGEAPDRELRYGDIAILLRAATEIETYRDALRALGVPAACDRGRFARRQEVQDLVALATWLEQPDDAYALAHLLRSPLVGLGDDDLWRLAVDEGLGKAVRSRLNGSAGAADGEPVEVAEAIALLSAWRQYRGVDPLAATVRRIVAERAFGAVLTALPDAERRLANVEKLLDDLSAAEAARVSSADLLANLAWRRDEGSSADPEGLVWDPDEDAVALMTVHGAKGLERPVIYVADLARRPTADRAPMVAEWAGGLIVAGSADDKPALPAAARPTKRDRGPCLEFESERLLYVACTRARDRLVLSAALTEGKSSPAGSWWSALEAPLDELGLAAEALPVTLPASDSEAQVAWDRVERLRSLPAESPPDGCAAVQAVEPETVTKRIKQVNQPTEGEWRRAVRPASERLSAAQKGSIVHDLLRVAVLSRAAPRLDQVWAAAAAHGVVLSRDADAAEATALVEAADWAWRQDAVQQAMGAATVLAEAPFMVGGEPLLEGRVDLVGVLPDRVLVIDYKTGSLAPGRMAQYRQELGWYADAVRQRWPDRPVELWLVLVDLLAVEAVTGAN